MAIIDFFDRGWAMGGDAVAYVQDHRRFSFDEVGALSCRIANRLLALGLPVQGPFPADTIFLKARDGELDAIVTMYHDQGQIAIKLMGFSQGVTVQGGLPIPITTPAHGTAFDIVGLGKANVDATANAFKIACRMGQARLQTRAPS